MKYYLESFYDYSPEVRSGVIDYVNIGAAVGTYENRKEEEWKTETESFKFKYYKTLKEEVGNTVREFLKNIQTKYNEVLNKIDEIAKNGANKAQEIANQNLLKIQKAFGLK